MYFIISIYIPRLFTIILTVFWDSTISVSSEHKLQNYPSRPFPQETFVWCLHINIYHIKGSTLRGFCFCEQLTNVFFLLGTHILYTNMLCKTTKSNCSFKLSKNQLIEYITARLIMPVQKMNICFLTQDKLSWTTL